MQAQKQQLATTKTANKIKIRTPKIFSAQWFFFRVPRLVFPSGFDRCCRQAFDLLHTLFLDEHTVASLSLLILQIYVRIAHFMFSSYFFMCNDLRIFRYVSLFLSVCLSPFDHRKLLLQLTFFVKNVKYFCAFQRNKRL